MDKSGDTLFLGMVNNIPGTSSREISLYQYEIASSQLIPLFEKQALVPSFSVYKFRKGKFYSIPTANSVQVLDKNGTITTLTGPSSSYSTGFMFGRNKIYFITTNSAIPRLEVYSKPI